MLKEIFLNINIAPGKRGIEINRVYSFSYFKYGIYKLKEVKNIRLRNECEA